MPKKGYKGKRFYAKKSKDKKQDSRIKSLEKFVYKTIENKQINLTQFSNLSTTNYQYGAFLQVKQGTADGVLPADEARIGNSVTLMSQRFKFMLHIPLAGDLFNTCRVMLVESVDGSQPMALTDVLYEADYSVHGNKVFTSHYTTKTQTNKRYKIHFDKVVTLNRYQNNVVNWNYNVNYKGGKVIEFDGNTSALPTNHRLSILAVSDSGSILHPVLTWSARSIYKDA